MTTYEDKSRSGGGGDGRVPHSDAPVPEGVAHQPPASAAPHHTQPPVAGRTVMDWLVAEYPNAKKGTLRKLIENHAVMLNGRAVRSLKQPLTPADKPVVGDSNRRQAPFRGGLKILYQDADILIIRKPAGLLTSTTEDEPRPTVLGLLQERMARKNQKMSVHLVHRLDRDASGLLVLARGIRPLANLKMQFRRHTITREYELVVHGVPQPGKGRLEHRLLETPAARMVVCGPEEGKPAILDYEVLQSHGGLSLVRCQLFTGRKHQIRVQFAAIGHRLVGDPVYGTPAGRKGGEGRLALHAVRLGLNHPRSGKPVNFTSPLPDAIVAQFKTAGRPA